MNLPEEISILAKKFSDSNYHLYLVGGPVRDLKLGRQTKDWDFTTDAQIEQFDTRG
jgi:poly(A) polymerase